MAVYPYYPYYPLYPLYPLYPYCYPELATIAPGCKGDKTLYPYLY